MANTLRLGELTREEVRALAPHATVVLPTASTEQHGPHLPLNTDTLLGEAVALRAAELASAEVPVVVAPVLSVGISGHHLFSCALSLKSSTYIAMLNDLADSLVASGFKRLFVLNSHGGNDECVKLLAKDLVLRHEVAVGAGSYWELAVSAILDAGGEQVGRLPGHSGGFETSLVMAVAPQLVRTDRVPAVDPEPPAMFARSIAKGLVAQKYGEWARIGGYTEAASKASPEAGKILLEAISGAVASAIVAFHRASDS